MVSRPHPDERDIVAAHVDLLAELGHRLRMPHSKPLGQGLFELRFDMTRRSWRISYYFGPDRIIVLLTVFHKQCNNEAKEVARARAALARCQADHQTKNTGKDQKR